jgi:DNA-binding transcriptional ArsR family regulator
MTSGDGILLAEMMNEFCGQVGDIGPLGKSEGMDKNVLQFKLKAVRQLIPYIKLVESERLRAPSRSEEAYTQFFASDDFVRLFNDLIIDKLAVSQIMLLLGEKPRTTGEISEILGLDPSDVSRHMNRSSRQGLVRYDGGSKRYAPA